MHARVVVLMAAVGSLVVALSTIQNGCDRLDARCRTSQMRRDERCTFCTPVPAGCEMRMSCSAAGCRVEGNACFHH